MRFEEAGDPGRRAAGNVEAAQRLLGFGDAWVLLVDFSGGVTGWSVLAYGQTTNLKSPHSRDQMPLFAARRLRRAWYSEADILAHAARTYRP